MNAAIAAGGLEVGDVVTYATFGLEPELRTGVITGFGEKNGRLVFDLAIHEGPPTCWGYEHQVLEHRPRRPR